MAEELQNKLKSFIQYILDKIDQKFLPDFKNKYEELEEFINKLLIFTKEEFEEFENMLNECGTLQEEIKKYKHQKEIDSDKIKSMMAELENNLDLKEKNNKLNEDYNILKQKYNVCYNDNSNYQLKLKENEKLIKNLQEQINNTKKENFEKFEKITELEKNIRLNETNISQTNEKINKITIENNDLKKENVEIKNNYLEQQKNYQNKLLILEKQIRILTDANNTLAQENNEVQSQLKDFQIYTNMVRAKTQPLKEKDFSVLEGMSHRAESAELEVQRLLVYIDELKDMNEKLRNKMKLLEDYALLQIKYDHEINTGIDTTYDLKNRLFTDEEKAEIERVKNEPSLLMQLLIKLKTENLVIHNQLKDITIECNQQLREAKRK